MPSIRSNVMRIWLPLLFSLALVGCGDKSSQETFSADSGGKHIDGWLPAGHKTAAIADLNACTECHGSNYAGGISKVSCTRCHLGDEQNVHPLDWGIYTYAYHARYADQNGTTSCANIYCHGADLKGVTSSGSSCTKCHIGGTTAVHPAKLAVWSNVTSSNSESHGAYVAAKGTASCAVAACHGTGLQGTAMSGRSCTACHLKNW